MPGKDEVLGRENLFSFWRAPLSEAETMRRPRIPDEKLAQILARLASGTYYYYIVEELGTSTRTIARVKDWAREASFATVKAFLHKMGPQKVNDKDLGPDDILKALRPTDYIKRLEKALAAQESVAQKGDRMTLLVEFMRALPLIEPDYDVEWLAETMRLSGEEVDPNEVYQKLLCGELPRYYDPPWQNHPVFSEVSRTLFDHPLLRQIDDFVNAVNACVKECPGVLWCIYQDCVAEMAEQVHKDGGKEAAQRHLVRNGWDFAFSIYSDALHWFSGKHLREVSDQDYFVKESRLTRTRGKPAWLCGAGHTTFHGPLIGVLELAEIEQINMLVEIHLGLRKKYRESKKARALAQRIAHLRVLRSELVEALARFGSVATQS